MSRCKFRRDVACTYCFLLLQLVVQQIPCCKLWENVVKSRSDFYFVAMSCGNFQHGNVLLDKLHERVAILATLCSTCNVTLFATQVERICCSYYFIFMARINTHSGLNKNVDVIDISKCNKRSFFKVYIVYNINVFL